MNAIDPNSPEGRKSSGARPLAAHRRVSRPAGRGWAPVLALGVIVLTALGGCSTLRLSEPVPKAVFNDGPDERPLMSNGGSALALLTGERPVRGLDGSPQAPWPKLSTVPDRPQGVPDPIARQKDMDALVADREAAARLASELTAYRNSPDQQQVQKASANDPLAPKNTAPAAAPAQPMSAVAPDIPDAPPPVPAAPTIVIAGPAIVGPAPAPAPAPGHN